MLTTTEAFVLRSVRYDDHMLIVDMLCRSCGRTSFLVRLSSSKRGAMQRQMFQPLTLLEVVADLRQGKALQKLRTARMLTPYADIPFQPAKTATAFFLAEFLLYATRDDSGQSDGMFAFLRHSMHWYDAAREGYANFHLVFIIHMMRFLGFYPEPETYAEGCFFDLREGIMCRVPPSHDDFLSAADTLHLVNMLRLNYASMSRFGMSQEQRNRAISLLLRYCRLHIPAFPEMKTLPVLRDLFAGNTHPQAESQGQ